GAYPGPYGSDGSLIEGADGFLYGTTKLGGAYGFGKVFRVNESGSDLINNIITVASFNNDNGANPAAGLITDSSGNLYGTTSSGGPSGLLGTVFELAAGSNTITTVAPFKATQGSGPWSGLIQDSNGNSSAQLPGA